MAQRFAFSMREVGKIFPPNKQVLRNISLSFFYGAKSGVLGLNGAGKSTLLRIMAGEDKNINGEARPGEGITVGYLHQEPVLDEGKPVRQVVEEGVGELPALLKRYEEINNSFAEPDLSPEKMEELIAEQSKVQEKLDALDGWDLDRRLEIAMDALRLPSPEAVIKILSGGERRRVALCRLLLQKPDEDLKHKTDHLFYILFQKLDMAHQCAKLFYQYKD